MKKAVGFLMSRFHISDLTLFASILFLSGLGVVMVYSASGVMAADKFGDSLFYLKRQILFVVFGFIMMFFVSSVPYEKWIRLGGWFLLAGIAALVLTLVPGFGVSVNGAQRWLSLGGVRIQVAEFVKLATVLYMTWALVRKGEQVKSFTYGLLPMGIVAGVLCGLLMKQPDFGNTVVVAFIAGIMIFLAGGRIAYLGAAVLTSLPVIYLAVMGADYRKKRLLAFLNPWDDPQNTSYQIVQSFTAFFSGGLTGSGLGNSREKLYYLPEVHTDFIMSVVGEELGFIGVALTVIVFALLVYRGFRIAMRAKDPAGMLLAAGLTSLLAVQTTLNMCVVMGLLPTKGLPLPFISHGGSSLLASFLALGLILSVSNEAKMEGSHHGNAWL